MRQLAHTAIGLFFWVLMLVLWILLVVEDKAGAANITYSAMYVAVIVGAVLAVTLWWIRHNTSIYRRKGPRTGRPEMAPRIDEDRLGRPVRWQVDGGSDAVLGAGHLVVEVDGPAKVYLMGA